MISPSFEVESWCAKVMDSDLGFLAINKVSRGTGVTVVRREEVITDCYSRDREEDWNGYCRDFEENYRVMPAKRFGPKKVRRFQRVREERKDESRNPWRENPINPRMSCDVGGLGLFHDVDVELAMEFVPPASPMICRLEDLLKFSEEKRKPRRLVERRIQVTGRRMPKFIPPTWNPCRNRNQCSKLEEVMKHLDVQFQTQNGKMDSWMEDGGENLESVEVSGAVKEGVDGEFFEQLWSCPKGKKQSTA
jgi:hypothetical protein